MVTRLAVFEPRMIEAISEVLAATDHPGLTGSELEVALQGIGLPLDPAGSSKRARLALTLTRAQHRDGCGNPVVRFLTDAMDPSRYVRDPQRFHQLQAQLNEHLVFFGYRVTDQGKVARAQQAHDLDEASRLAGSLMSELRRRGCHPALLLYCDQELISRSLFHAIGEAAKSIPDRIRRHTGLGSDGDQLYTQVFGSKSQAPMIQISPMRTDSETIEHTGFKNLLTGIHGHYRNPRAHSTRHHSSEDLQDFHEAFALFSYVHRRLDSAGVRP